MNDSHRFLSMVVKSFPIQGVSAIGLKLLGFLGSSSAELLGRQLVLNLKTNVHFRGPEEQLQEMGSASGSYMAPGLWDWELTATYC